MKALILALILAASSAFALCPITSPTNGSTLASATPTFSWSSVGGAVGYMLWFSKASGQNDYQVLEADQTSAVPSNQSPYALPTDGSTLYATLYSWDGSTWTAGTVCSYTAATLTYGVITSPTNGSTLSNSATQTFSWSAGNQCTVNQNYELRVGSSSGACDYNNVGGTCLDTNSLSGTATNVPTDTSTVFARLYCHASSFTSTVYSYHANGFVTSAVSPSSGMISATSQAFTWTAGTNITAYQLHFGSISGGSDLQNFALTGTSQTVTGLPAGSVYLRFWTYNGSTWSFVDYTYTAV